MTTGSFSDYARHIGASRAYVSKLKSQGRLVLIEVDGKQMVDFELSDRLVRNTTGPGQGGQRAQRIAQRDVHAAGGAVGRNGQGRRDLPASEGAGARVCGQNRGSSIQRSLPVS